MKRPYHNTLLLILLATCLFIGCANKAKGPSSDRLSISGVYPHLAMMNNHGECGTGAVVPWAGRLWVVTYAPHYPMGSSDKLYEITPDLKQTIRPESVGGTPANRMIHRESNQLILSHYFIDAKGSVRVVPPKQMPGRMTANARHLTDPANKVYFATMEEGLYEVNVHTLEVKCWINDSNGNKGAKVFKDALNSQLPGYHGKGAYTGQGQLIYANNGERSKQARVDPTTPSGALATWGGPGKDWQMVLREQFTEVTGPGGIYGNTNNNDPVWTMGWDHRSVLLKVLDNGKWHRYRLPKASFSYDGAHGWNTEWPRIRDIGEKDLLATMHGTFWKFPKTFSVKNSFGIYPLSNYLKVIGDFARWGDYVVLGCDDSAQKEFLNTRPTKARHGAPLRSNSNLWFVKPDRLKKLGPALGSGGVWLEEDVKAGVASDPFLSGTYDKQILFLAHRGDKPATFTIEIDKRGNNQWRKIDEVKVLANACMYHLLPEPGVWFRVTAKQDTKAATCWAHAASFSPHRDEPADIFKGLATASTKREIGGVLRSLGGNVELGLIAQNRANADRPFYKLNEKLEFIAGKDAESRGKVWAAAAPDTNKIPLKVDGNSVLVIEDGKRYRLPLAPGYAKDKPFGEKIGQPRRVREVVTERDLANIAGTFYELPARNAGGFSHIRPVASHPFRIHDFASYRGLLIMTGVDAGAKGPRIYKSKDGKAAVWAGVIDELWRMGKPVGVGGPWYKTSVKAGQPSDPYLMYGYDKKKLTIESDTKTTVTFQIDPSGTGRWHSCFYWVFEVAPNKPFKHEFLSQFNTHWVRLISDTDATITATFVYE